MPTELPTTEVLPPFDKSFVVDKRRNGMVRARELSAEARAFASAEHPTEGPLVHTLPTSGSIGVDVSYQAHASRFVNPQLARYRMILENSDSITSGKHLNRLNDCRRHAFFTVHRESKQVRVASNRCNLRWCPMCQQTRRTIIAHGVSKWVVNATSPKFMTLTLKSSDDSLEFQLKRLYDSFRLFRRRVFPKRLIRGGFWFFQVTWSTKRMQWHPHLHCLIDADFIPRRKLSKAWFKATGDSMVADIRAVKDAVKAAQYVARYATAPASLLSFRPDQGFEIIQALRDQRIVGAWGNARGVPLSPRKPEDASKWMRALGYSAVVKGRHVHPVLTELYDCWRSGKPYELSLDVFDCSFSSRDPMMQLEPETSRQLEIEFSGPAKLSMFARGYENE